MNGTFTPTALNTPEIVASFTATATTLVQVTVDTSPLQSGDILNVKLADDVTGSSVIFTNQDCTLNTTDPSAKSYFDILYQGDSFTLTLEQTAGTLRSINWAIRKD